MNLIPHAEPLDPTTAGPPPPFERPGRRHDPSATSWAIAALAFGLAYSPLPPHQAVAEIVDAGDHPLLVRARRDLVRQLPEHRPAIRGRARALLDGAIRATACPRPGQVAVVAEAATVTKGSTSPTPSLDVRFL